MKDKDSRQKAQKSIANISCGQGSHDQYIKNIYSDPSGKLKFACSECIFEGVINEKEFPIKHDIDSFLSLMFSRHSSVVLKPKLLPKEKKESVKGLAQACLRYKAINTLLQDQTNKVIGEEIKKMKHELSKKFIEILNTVEKKLISHAESVFQETSKPFLLVLDLLDHEENLKREINELKPEALKAFLEKYFERELELQKSQKHLEEMKRFLEELEVRTKLDLPLEDQVPKFRGIVPQIPKIIRSVFNEEEFLEREINLVAKRSFKVPWEVNGSDQLNSTQNRMSEKYTSAMTVIFQKKNSMFYKGRFLRDD